MATHALGEQNASVIYGDPRFVLAGNYAFNANTTTIITTMYEHSNQFDMKFPIQSIQF